MSLAIVPHGVRFDGQPMAAETPLTTFQRILLGTDGTVTHLLAAYADEPIEVVKLQQTFDTPDSSDLHLDLSGQEMLLRRRVLLRGRRTKQNLVYAETVVVLDRVSPSFADALVDTDKPIGILLGENRMETFREILVVDHEPAGPCARYFGVEATDQLIFRTYRVMVKKRPILLITEKFPAESFRDGPDNNRSAHGRRRR